jgi:hypothetical protein
MKCHKGLVAAVLLCAVLAFSATAQANLVVNGSFEDASPTGWVGGFASYSHATQVYYTGPAPAGAGDTYGWAWGGGTFGSATQTIDVTVVAGQAYSFSAWLAAYTGNDDFAEVRLEFFDAGDASVSSVVFFDGNNGSSSYIIGSANAAGLADPSVGWTLFNWTQYEAAGTIPVDAASAKITLTSNATGSNGNDAYVDLVSLRAGAAPELQVDTSSKSFPDQQTGSVSPDTLLVNIANIGNADLHITPSIINDGLGEFSVSPNTPQVIAASNNIDLTLTWTPNDAPIGIHAAQLQLVHNAGNRISPLVIDVRGVVTEAVSGNAFRFAVIGDTQGGEYGGHSNLLTRLMEAVNSHSNIEYVLFPGDLVADSGSAGWTAWKNRTAIVGTNSLGRDKRLMTPGNHDRGTGGTFANWQSIFNWLPDSQLLNGEQGIDQVDYFVDHGDVRFISISTDAPGLIYNSRVVNNAPPALDWLREVMKDVDGRNADADPNDDINYVFSFSHRPITTQFESPTGGTDGAWWGSMTGQDIQSGDHVLTAFMPGHWHMYQPSRPDPDVDTMEVISGTGGGGLEGQAHRNRHGYTIVTIDNGKVTAAFYGDYNQSSDNWNFQLLDSYTIAQIGGLLTGELALYEFEVGIPTGDSSLSLLSKGHPLTLKNGAAVLTDAAQGQVLDLRGSAYADIKTIGNNNLSVLKNLKIEFDAKLNNMPSSNEVIITFGGADGGGSLSGQECANVTYEVTVTSAGNLRMNWQHDDATWEGPLLSTAAVANPTEWHHYKIIRDAANKEVCFYVDGTQLGSAVSFTNRPSGGGSGDLFLGAGIGGVSSFDGWIDNVQICNRLSDKSCDLNDDGDISILDLEFLAGVWLQDNTAADLAPPPNGDNIVDFLDYAIFASCWE